MSVKRVTRDEMIRDYLKSVQGNDKIISSI